jgi:hypothetical protein
VPSPGEQSLFDPRDMRANGARSLIQGLPNLPNDWSHPMVVPSACWKTDTFGAVLFLAYEKAADDGLELGQWLGKYNQGDDGWTPSSSWFGGQIWQGTGPAAKSVGLGGRVIREGGSSITTDPEDGEPALVVWGWHSTEAAEVFLVQGGTSQRCSLGHFGTWITGSESDSSWRVEAHDDSGNCLGFVEPRMPT